MKRVLIVCLAITACAGPVAPSPIVEPVQAAGSAAAATISTPTPSPSPEPTATPQAPRPTPTATPIPTPEERHPCSVEHPTFDWAVRAAQYSVPANARIDLYTALLVIHIREQGVSAAEGNSPGVVLTKASDEWSEAFLVFVATQGPRLTYLETCRPAAF